jgi:hypothetical protein
MSADSARRTLYRVLERLGDVGRLGSPGLPNWNILAGGTRTEYRQRFSTKQFIDG